MEDIEGILNRKVAGAHNTLLVKKKFLPPLSKKEELNMKNDISNKIRSLMAVNKKPY